MKNREYICLIWKPGICRAATIHVKPRRKKIPVFCAIEPCRYAWRGGRKGRFFRRTAADLADPPPPARRETDYSTNKHGCGNKTTAISILHLSVARLRGGKADNFSDIYATRRICSRRRRRLRE
jgi:hypothetical protein